MSEIVVGPFADQAILAATRRLADFYRCFGVQRQTQGSLGFVRRSVDGFQFVEYGVRLLDLFLGLHFATLVRWNPK